MVGTVVPAAALATPVIAGRIVLAFALAAATHMACRIIGAATFHAATHMADRIIGAATSPAATNMAGRIIGAATSPAATNMAGRIIGAASREGLRFLDGKPGGGELDRNRHGREAGSEGECSGRDKRPAEKVFQDHVSLLG
jgi:hypothetical protein